MDYLNTLKLILIGFIQGITEPLPISSSAHMIIVGHLLNIGKLDINTEIIINFASTIAIAIFFRKKIISLFINTFTKKKTTDYSYLDRSYFLKLLVASIPAVIAGVFFKDLIDDYFMNIKFVSIALILTGFLLLFTYLMIKGKTIFTDEITFQDSVTIGLMQALAILPGISRSGSTFFGGTTRNIKLKRIFDFSFFLYLIASFGALVLSFFDLDIKDININSLIIPFIITFITTYFSIKLFHKILNKKTLLMFMIYTFIIGLIFLILPL